MRTVALVAHQVRYDQRAFWRDRQAVFGIVALPLIFLVILVALFGNDDSGDFHVKNSTYYVPAIIALSVVSATFQYLAISLVERREAGILKRVRGTPLPPFVYILGRTATAVLIALGLTVLVLAFGRLAYGARVQTHALPGLVATVVVGTAAFACLGFAAASLIASENAAAPITQLIVLPLNFVSGVFVPTDAIPAGLLDVGKVFPIYHVAHGLLVTVDPRTTGSGIEVVDLAVLAGWGAAGLLVALRFFGWTPRTRA